MVQLPSSGSNDKFQKIFAWLLMIAAGWGIIKVANMVLPTIIEFATNVYLTMLIVAPLVALGLYIATNPLIVWGIFRTLSAKLTSFIIKMDPLSVMDRYVDYLRRSLRNLNATKLELEAKKEEMGRLIHELKSNIDDNLQKGAAAISQNQTSIASLSGTMVETDRQSLRAYEPIYQKLVNNCDFLNELSENWDVSIKKLSYTVDKKRQEYITLKKMAKALNQAKEFASGDTDAARIYQQSVKELEISVSKKIAVINEFERNSKDILGMIKVEKKMVQDEGLRAIEDYMKSGALKLDFENVPEAEVVKSQITQQSKYNFNNK